MQQGAMHHGSEGFMNAYVD